MNAKIDLDNGKYTIILPDPINNENHFRALRNGEEWRDLSGDNLVYWAAVRIIELEEQLKTLSNRVQDYLVFES